MQVDGVAFEGGRHGTCEGQANRSYASGVQGGELGNPDIDDDRLSTLRQRQDKAARLAVVLLALDSFYLLRKVPLRARHSVYTATG